MLALFEAQSRELRRALCVCTGMMTWLPRRRTTIAKVEAVAGSFEKWNKGTVPFDAVMEFCEYFGVIDKPLLLGVVRGSTVVSRTVSHAVQLMSIVNLLNKDISAYDDVAASLHIHSKEKKSMNAAYATRKVINKAACKLALRAIVAAAIATGGGSALNVVVESALDLVGNDSILKPVLELVCGAVQVISVVTSLRELKTGSAEAKLLRKSNQLLRKENKEIVNICNTYLRNVNN